MNIFNIEEKDLAIAEYSDLYKEKYYMRPRNIDMTWTVERFKKEVKVLAKELNEEEWRIK